MFVFKIFNFSQWIFSPELAASLLTPPPPSYAPNFVCRHSFVLLYLTTG
jgi:hypothetical protein